MIDPSNITNFNLSHAKLEETILFWICAAGKNGVSSAKSLEKLLAPYRKTKKSPFAIIRLINEKKNLAEEMRIAGIGCFNNKSKYFLELVNSGINLKTCSIEELESISGIGNKTARCFLIHSRPDQKLAGLDTHVLSYMRDLGYDVPKSTPSAKRYMEIQQQFLELLKISGLSSAEFDLLIWNYYSGKDKSEKTREFLFSIKNSSEIDMNLKIDLILKADLKHLVSIENKCFPCPWEEGDFNFVLRDGKTTGILVRSHSEIVGYMIYYRKRKAFHIINMAVHSNFRRKKIGFMMFEWLVAKLKKNCEIEATVSDANLGAHLFLKNLGFVAECVLPNFYDTGDAYDFYYKEGTPYKKSKQLNSLTC